jgi:hypothetical protein
MLWPVYSKVRNAVIHVSWRALRLCEKLSMNTNLNILRALCATVAKTSSRMCMLHACGAAQSIISGTWRNKTSSAAAG